MREYKITCRKTTPWFSDGVLAGWSTKFGIITQNIDAPDAPSVPRTTHVQASTLDDLDHLVEVAAAAHPALFVSVSVEVADGRRKPNGFAQKYDSSRVLRKVEPLPEHEERLEV